ncbi:MAG: outer membrane lipoprotein carrier protein LolA [Verrucomicrobia bacterium]|nr:outer membrane lipoprotein carrier protein LolA [Verrucomicrobiota bacterium]
MRGREGRFPGGVVARLLGIVGVAGGLLGAQGADTNSVLDAWLAAQTHLRTWQADFTQTRRLETLTQPLVATGRVWFAPPNRFRWELGRPVQTIALREPDQLWVIYPRLKRAERYPMTGAAAGQWREALELLEAGFPRNRAQFQSRFRLLGLAQANGAWQLTLTPVSAWARRLMTELHLELATNDFSLLSTELRFADGSRLRNDFTNAVWNEPLDDSLFRWQPEPAYKITEPLGK